MSGYYHQDERDEAVGQGCLLLLIFLVGLITFSVWLIVVTNMQKPKEESIMDGSTAGANAVTMEEVNEMKERGYV